MRLLLLLLLSLSVTGCSTRDRNQGESCRDASDCTVEAGELAACLDGQCQAVECLGTEDCPLGTWCPVEDDNYACIEGCQTSTDCQAGFSCSAEGQCEVYGCRNSNLDCWIGEVCNQDSGECEQGDPLHCSECVQDQWLWDDQGTLDTCDDVFQGHDGCGGVGSACLSYQTGGASHCLVPCQDQDECPRGYTCQDVDWTFNTEAICGFPLPASARACLSNSGCTID
jgi:hypothetical protein